MSDNGILEMVTVAEIEAMAEARAKKILEDIAERSSWAKLEE